MIMLRTSPLQTILSLCLLAHAGTALAQQAVAEAPPKLDRLEEGKEAPIVITPKPKESKIIEKREGGRVTEVQVQAGPSTYTMKPHTPAGNAQPGDAQSGAIRAPQWTILEFDLFKKKKNDPDSVPEQAEAPPPPPPPAK
jgi:hypothetical protein